ncbi:hypothetical protein [Glycomyces salinus]|uniref:hypothetical protein n=1 Tax=Glycomyces salinus TaxID=980294 RepID=UPI0018EC53B9|nr:hypothetical protein [Glycomyces salinus]
MSSISQMPPSCQVRKSQYTVSPGSNAGSGTNRQGYPMRTHQAIPSSGTRRDLATGCRVAAGVGIRSRRRFHF